jgi:hypothetical protein
LFDSRQRADTQYWTSNKIEGLKDISNESEQIGLRKELREVDGSDLIQTVAGRAGFGLNRETSSPKLKLVLLKIRL